MNRQKTVNKQLSQYSLELPMSFEMGVRISGAGGTLGIGSKTVRCFTNRELPPGRMIQLMIAWPVSLPDGTGLNLWIKGRVRHSTPNETEIQLLSHEFRTRSNVLFARRARAQAPKPRPRAKGAGA